MNEGYTTKRRIPTCDKCAARMPDPDLDKITLYTCPTCHARYIRLHYWEGTCFWRRLRWWQRVA